MWPFSYDNENYVAFRECYHLQYLQSSQSWELNTIAACLLWRFGAQEAHAILARGGLSEELASETLAACGDNSIHVHVPGCWDGGPGHEEIVP